MTKEVSTERVRRLEERFDWLDEHGTRAINVLALQVSELIKDMGELKGVLSEGRRIRWSTVLAFIAIILPMYALIIGTITGHVH